MSAWRWVLLGVGMYVGASVALVVGVTALVLFDRDELADSRDAFEDGWGQGW